MKYKLILLFRFIRNFPFALNTNHPFFFFPLSSTNSDSFTPRSSITNRVRIIEAKIGRRVERIGRKVTHGADEFKSGKLKFTETPRSSGEKRGRSKSCRLLKDRFQLHRAIITKGVCNYSPGAFCSAAKIAIHTLRQGDTFPPVRDVSPRKIDPLTRLAVSTRPVDRHSDRNIHLFHPFLLFAPITLSLSPLLLRHSYLLCELIRRRKMI